MFSRPTMKIEIIHDNQSIRCIGTVNGMPTYDSGAYVIAECGMRDLAECLEVLEDNARGYAGSHGANVAVTVRQITTAEFGAL